ncbi:MAG: hypothetical protein RMM17_10200 [Acidobacteriota bacterium]|nr:hypothetical protein [Blastocatellia bacterium]MDW8413041.1 hypothetical protein [Acidobacteriota bacterium]
MRSPKLIEVARCPNCSFPIDQFGRRTECAKCGRRLTVACIDCDTENPFYTQHCLVCGVEYKKRAVEKLSQQIDALRVQLDEYDRLLSAKYQAEFYEHVATVATWVFTLITGAFFMLHLTDESGVAVALGLGGMGYLASRSYGSLALACCGLSKGRDWAQLYKTIYRLKREIDDLCRKRELYVRH